MADDGKPRDQTLQELDALSHTLYQAHSNRRHASLALPRGVVGEDVLAAEALRAEAARPRTRRMSMTSPFRSRGKAGKKEDDDEDDDRGVLSAAAPSKSRSFAAAASPALGGGEKKKGLWGWKPMRALSHIGMTRLGCLFSVEVAVAQGLPSSMDGLRLAVAVRKKESREGAVQTMPSRVQQGAADFEETLFVRCHVYCSGGGAGKPPAKFEPRPFLLSVVAVDAPELDLGQSTVDVSALVKESTEKSQQGERVRQWQMAFPLAGKAKGGELVVTLAFQIMEDGGVGLYSQPATKTAASSSTSSALFARKQSKTSFSITSPKVTRSEPSFTPAKGTPAQDLSGIDDFKLDGPSAPVPEPKQDQKREPEPEPEAKVDDSEFPEFDFDVVDKGVEGQEEKDAANADSKKEDKDKEEEEEGTTPAAGDEVVKEVVHDSASMWRLNELEAITNQIKALESLMLGDTPEEDADKPAEPQEDEAAVEGLEADEEEVTREFLQLLEQGEDNGKSAAAPQVSSLKSSAKPGTGADEACYISDLGKGLGPIVQTRDGGYLAATNPFDIPVVRKELPKLAMQLSKPFILRGQKLPGGGAEVFQRLCAGGCEALCAKLGALTATDEVVGKTAEQIAFEGMASAIISARSKELGASSSAAESVSLLRTMSAAMSDGRKERIATGIWNAHEAPVTVDEILPFSLQKIETMAIEALKVQAGTAEEQAPFDVSPVTDAADGGHPLDAAVPPEEWASACAGADAATMLVVAQLRDPMRRYEAVGAPSIVVIQAGRAATGADGETRFKVANMHVGGMRLKTADRRSVWDGERQRLTATHWLVAYGLGKAGKKGRPSGAAAGKVGTDVLWSMSSRVVADMWLKPMRNPDVKIAAN
ncbi:unnamed protein product [Triticum turgidum subsp. durum]|nr:unnamed protein product [Triticum turgidum subsp. durum]